MCQDSVSYDLERSPYISYDNQDHPIKNNLIKSQSLGNTQQGASTAVLALFVVAILVTAIVGLLFGHKIGYQRGYHSMQTETKQAVITGKEATQELKDLRISNKIVTNEAATAKQELEISLANLKELRENQQALTVENKQVAQLNDIYAELLSEKGGMPLQVLGAKIEPLPENAFEYGFDVGMLASDGKAKRLKPTLTLLNDDDFVEVPLDPVSYTIEGVARIRGRFTMPSGFKPLQAKLSLKAGGQEVEQLYDWKLGAKVDSMPLSLLDLPEVDKSPIEP
ncbi:hypothetical protein [Psychrobacter sp. DAB_AL32B]|uniref:hypothetical protein n=1 Tax=Psychrobacter sp. DAB_AL32B TaxID=1028414 RepID=UPI0020C4D767|nr:hypothetical protein [Psychrobacter sp. DAB_AL32B]